MPSSIGLQLTATFAACVLAGLYTTGSLAQHGTPELSDSSSGQTAHGRVPDGWRRVFRHALGGEEMLLINETTGEIRSEGVARRTGSNLFSPTEYNNHTAAGNVVIATIPVPGRPHGIAVNPNSGLAFVTAFDTDRVHAIALANHQLVQTTTLAAGSHPHSIAVDTSNNRVYVTNIDDLSVLVIDGSTGAVIALIAGVFGNPVGIDADSGRHHAMYVHGGQNLTILKSDNTTELPIDTGASNGYVAIDAARNLAYVSKNNPNGMLAIVAISSGLRGPDITLGGHVADLAVNEATRFVYVANDGSNVLNVVNGATNTLATSVSVGNAPSDVAVNPATNCVFVANEGSNSVSVVSGVTNAVVDTIAVGNGPKAIVVDPATNRVYVANKAGSSVSVIQMNGCAGGPVPTVTPSAQPSQTPAATLPEAPEHFNRNVYVLVFDPRLNNGKLLRDNEGWRYHGDITRDTVAFYEDASRGRLTYTIVHTTVVEEFPLKVDGFRYTAESWLAAKGSGNWHTPDGVDYTAILTDNRWDLCGRVNRGEIDEIWIYNGPAFGFWESTLAGPNAYFYNSLPVQGNHGCEHLVPIMGPSPERTIGEAIHNFGHRMESTMQQLYGSWDQTREPTHNWERFALARRNSGGAVSYSGCGDIHNPPNAAIEYGYNNTGNATLSNCDAWNAYPNIIAPNVFNRTVTCNDWGCTDLGYYRYWLRHLPRFEGCSDGVSLNDWWVYLVYPDRALTRTQANSCAPPGLNRKVWLPLAASP